METCLEDLFSLYRSTIHSQWPEGMQGATGENSDLLGYRLMCGPRMPDVDQASPLERQQQPSGATFEDEETCHGALGDDGEGFSPAGSKVRATVSIFHEPVPRDDANLSAYPSPKLSVDTYSDVTSPKGETSFQPYPFPSTSSFNPYGEHSNHPSYGFSVQPQPASNTMVDNVSCNPPEYEQPTDLSMPKGNQNENHTDSDTEDSDDDDDGIPLQPSNQQQPGSSIRYPTYTHLSDVSNDSEDVAVGHKQPTPPYTNTPTASYTNTPRASYTDVRSGNHLESDFVPPLPHLGFVFGRLPLITNDKLTFANFEQLLEYIFTQLSRFVPPAILWDLFTEWKARIQDIHPELKKGNVVIRELNDNDQQSGTQQQGNGHEGRNANEEGEVIDLIAEQEGGAAENVQEEPQQQAEQSPPSEEQHLQHRPIGQPHIEQMQPEEPLAMYSLPDNPPTLGAESFIATVQPSPTPAEEFVLPAQINDGVGMQSAAITEEPVGGPSSQSSMVLPSMQPFFCLSTPAQNCTTQEPDEHQPMVLVPSPEPFSVLRAEESSCSQDHPMEQLCVAESSVLFSASVPEELPPMQLESTPETPQRLVALSSYVSSVQQVADEEHIRSCESRSREPWDHKGLLSFVARHAFTLPRHVWIERKEGQPRRSMRIAKKKQLKTYFLRERLHSKPSSDKRNG